MDRLTSTGIKFSASRARPDLLEPSHDEHVWVTIVAYRLSTEQARLAHSSPNNPVQLDMENVASVSTGCFVCEEPYSHRESYRKCKGEPTDV